MSNHPGVNPTSILFRAVLDEDFGMAEAALRRGAKVNARHEYGKTPLMFACQKANKDMIILLCKNKARKNAEDEEGENSLFYALHHSEKTAEESFEAAKTLIMLGGTPVAYGEFGYPIAYYLVGKYSAHQIKMLCLLGVSLVDEPIYYAKDENESFIHWLTESSRYTNEELVDLINLAVDQGVDIHEVNSDGKTALDLANERSNHNMVTAINSYLSNQNANALGENTPSVDQEKTEVSRL